APLWSFHQTMREQKEKLLEEADNLGQTIASLEKALAKGPLSEDVNGQKDRLPAMKHRYEAIQHMPTWPVDINTTWRFAAGLGVQISTAVLGVLVTKLFS